MTSPPRYLEGEALSAAVDWLRAHDLPAQGDTTPEEIEAHYPGGLHFFIAEHLVSPPDLSNDDDDMEPTQPALF